MNKTFYDKKTEIFKALANPVRLMIIDLLLEGEKCVCEIVKKLNLEQPHVSKNLLKLKKAGLIKDRRDGLNIYYSLAICCMSEFFECLNKIVEK